MNPEPPAPQPLPSKTCPFAIVSLTVGIASFCAPVAGSAAAIIFGALALGRIKSSFGALNGRGMAIAGIVLGGVSAFIPIVAILAGMLLPALAMARAEARQAKCTANVRVILKACRDYAADHDDALPADLRDLQQYLASSSSLTCPAANDASEVSYELVLQKNDGAAGNLKLNELPPETIIVREKQQNHPRGRVIGHADGSVTVVQDNPDGFRRYGD